MGKCKSKKCTSCGKKLPLESFSKQSSTNDGLSYECKECKSVRRKSYKSDNRKYNLMSRYSITKEDYNEIFIEQHGVCAICGKPESKLDKDGKPAWLACDHDHSTGKVRGLLCNACNTGLGQLGDNIKNLTSAIEYLTERGSYGED